MSRLLVVTRPALVPGFELAGVEAFGVSDKDAAGELIGQWIERGESGLIAIDAQLHSGLDPALMRRIDATDELYLLPIPGSEPLGAETGRQERIAEMIRRAVGFHITFAGESSEGSE